MMVDDVLGGTWKEEVGRHNMYLKDRLRKTAKNFCQHSPYPDRESNAGHPSPTLRNSKMC
jgi:hypothetical protein